MKSEVINIIKKTKFPYLLTSQVLSQVTINMMNFLLLVKIYEKTDSTFAVSMLWISYALPLILIGPFASTLVDILDRRFVLMGANLLQSLTILYYALFFKENVFLLYGITFFYSLINQFYVPAETASVSYLVKKEELPFASGMLYLTQQLSIVAGFALASLFNQVFGFSISLLLCSLFLFIAFVSVIFLPKMKLTETEKQSPEESIKMFFQSIYSGYKFIKSSKNILMTFSILIIVQIMFSIIIVSVPMIAKTVIKIPASLSGVYLVIPAGIGSMLGAFNIPAFLKNKWRKKYLIRRSLLLLSILIFLETFVVYYLPSPVNIIVSAVIVFFLGIFFTGVYIPAQTFLQESTPNNYKGRIFGNMWFVTTISTIIPLIFYGVITEIFGIRFVMVSISIVCFLMYYLSKNSHKFFKNNLEINEV